MNQAFLKNGEATSQFCSDYKRFTFEEEKKVHLQVDHEVPFGQLQVQFTWGQDGSLEEKSIEYLMMHRVTIEEGDNRS